MCMSEVEEGKVNGELEKDDGDGNNEKFSAVATAFKLLEVVSRT